MAQPSALAEVTAMLNVTSIAFPTAQQWRAAPVSGGILLDRAETTQLGAGDRELDNLSLMGKGDTLAQSSNQLERN